MVLLGLGLFQPGDDDSLEDINFPLNSSIVVDGFQGLDLLAAVMAKHSNLDLEIAGYTDSLGSADYNKRLSLKRAESVKTYLVTKGANASSIKTSGKGIDQGHDNATREGRFKNRHASLSLFETTNGLRAKVTYPRLLELFFGKKGSGMHQFTEHSGSEGSQDDPYMEKLTNLQKQIDALGESLQKRISEIDTRHAKMAADHKEKQARASMHMKIDKYTGVSVAGGVDDHGDFNGQIQGMYFRPVGKHFALQIQGDASYFDNHEDGQADAGFVFKKGNVTAAAAASYKWASIQGLDTARIGQGSIIADVNFTGGKIGVFGSFPIADGDVLGSTPVNGAFTLEQYVHVPTNFGLQFGASLTEKVDLSGFVSSLDTETTNSDVSAGLNLDVLLKEQLSWFIKVESNQALLEQEDNIQYLTGLRLGSWSSARYGVNDQITPVQIPRVRYEILQRTVRTGNTAPVADAGESRVNVPKGNVELNGSGSFDPEGDTLSYTWSQTGGPAVELRRPDSIIARFTGRYGETYQFQLTVRDSFGETGTDVVSIGMEAAPVPLPQINVFTALPSAILQGGNTTLSWATQFADSVKISGLGSVPPNGQVVVAPTRTTTYTMTAENESGTVTSDVTVTVDRSPEILSFVAIPATIVEGELVNLVWETVNSSNVTISPHGQVTPSGALLLSPETTTDYTLTARNAGETVSQTLTVTVIEQPEDPPVILFFSATPDSILEGEFVTLSWSVEDAEEVSISSVGRVSDEGSLIVTPDATITYTLTAVNDNGTVTESVTVMVEPRNTEPVAIAGPDMRQINLGTVVLNGSNSFDPDGDPLVYMWEQIGGPSVTLMGANTAMPSFTATERGVYHFRLTVNDGRGGFSTDTVTATVVDFKQ